MKYLILPLLTLSLLSCNKDETPTPVQTNTNQSNTFIGYLSSFDYINPNTNQNAGIQVSVIGTNDQVIATSTTDSTGKFQITNLPVGTFDFQYTKPGWAKYTTLSVNNSPGPKPTIFTFANGNPSSYLTYPLVRNIYSDIVDLKLDSTSQLWSNTRYHFTATLSLDPMDDLSKVNVNVFSVNTIGDGIGSFFTQPDSVRFIPPNKIYIRSYTWLNWESNTSKQFNVSVSSTKDYVQDLLLIKPYEYTMTFKSDGGIKVKTFTITKP
jgi:hypothetical protein